jgi:lysozyme family protein
MANFELIKAQIIPIEGGYVFDADDPGGETKYGISKHSYPDLDIKNLTLDEAAVIYKRDFWDVMRLDEVSDQSIAESIFWFGVNSGTKTSIQYLQKSMNILEDAAILPIDGIIGKMTLRWVNYEYTICDYCESSDIPRYQTLLLEALKLEQIHYYANIANNKPSQQKFLLGWINRVFKT